MTNNVDPGLADIPSCSVCLDRGITPAREAIHTVKIQYSGRNSRVTSPRIPVCKVHFDELIVNDQIQVGTLNYRG